MHVVNDQVHLLIYVLPICIKFQYVGSHFMYSNADRTRLRHDLLFATFVLSGVLATFKPYLTLSDPGLFVSMISLFPEIYPR